MAEVMVVAASADRCALHDLERYLRAGYGRRLRPIESYRDSEGRTVVSLSLAAIADPSCGGAWQEAGR